MFNNFNNLAGYEGQNLPLFQPTSKFVYVNRNVVQNTLLQKTPTVNGKIHINPNFKQNVHVNPHFNKSVYPATSSSIYINPQKLKQNLNYTFSVNLTSAAPLETVRPIPSIAPLNPQMTNLNDLKQNQIETTTSIAKGAVIKNTKTKLVRVASAVSSSTATEKERKCEVPTYKQKGEVSSRYRFIRRSLSKDIKTGGGLAINKIPYVKTRFKFNKLQLQTGKDTGNLCDTRQLKKKRFYFFNDLAPEKYFVKNRSSFVKINKILYKTSLNKLRISGDSLKRNGRKLITIRGQKYKLDANKRSLTSLTPTKKLFSTSTSKLNMDKIKWKRKEHMIFITNNTSKKLLLRRQSKLKSISFANKMKKCNISCPFFRKYGRCRGKEAGTCNRVHNPDQIILCPKFLQGACVTDKCLLSHKVSPEKMPTCKFFLEGLCTRENCQYLHVKINAKADICRNFLEGFCDKGKECDKRHQYICPEFEKMGKCAKRRCPYPHANVVRKRRISIKVASKSSRSRKTDKKHSLSKKSDNNDQLKTENSLLSEKFKIVENYCKKRYYADLQRNNCNIKEGLNENDQNDDNDDGKVVKRPKLGELPSFIPFEKL